MPHAVKKIDQHVAAAVKAINALTADGAKDFVAEVNRLRQQIVLAVVEDSGAQPFNRSAVKGRIETILEMYRRRFEEQLSNNERRLFIKGIQLIDTTIKTADLRLAIPYLSEQLLVQVQEYSASLITNLTDFARQRIAQELDLAVLGQKPQVDVVRAIGANLKDPSIFGTIAKRAATIYQTEVSRIENLAAQERMKQVAGQVPLRKEWMHSHQGVPRPGHLALSGTAIDPTGRFELKGADGKTYRILAPHDPILPVGETVSCRCKIIPVVRKYEQTKSKD